MAEVILALAVALLAAGAGVLRGGSLESLAETRFRAVRWLVAGLALQLVFELWSPEWMSRGGALVTVLMSNLAVGVFVVANRRVPGMLLIAAGLLLNVIVIALNGAMPVSPEAAESAGIRDSLALESLKHEDLDGSTLLPWLADVLPLPRLREVFSVGDVALALGIGSLVYARTTSSRPSAPTASEASG